MVLPFLLLTCTLKLWCAETAGKTDCPVIAKPDISEDHAKGVFWHISVDSSGEVLLVFGCVSRRAWGTWLQCPGVTWPAGRVTWPVPRDPQGHITWPAGAASQFSSAVNQCLQVEGAKMSQVHIVNFVENEFHAHTLLYRRWVTEMHQGFINELAPKASQFWSVALPVQKRQRSVAGRTNLGNLWIVCILFTWEHCAQNGLGNDQSLVNLCVVSESRIVDGVLGIHFFLPEMHAS